MKLSRAFHITILLVAVQASAGELKVDINRDGKNTLAKTATGYIQWTTASTGGTSSSGTTPITQSFPIASTGETITVSLAKTAQSAGDAGLTFTYYDAGTQIDGQKLVSDGITVSPAVGNTGGQIQMTITGLQAGEHSLLTFHNAGDAASALGTMAPVKVYLNGAYVTTMTPSIRSTDVATPTVYLNFTTSATSDITTVRFEADTTSSATTKNVVINGFEIDTPNSTRIAHTPSPADADEHVNADTSSTALSWLQPTAGNAASFDAYFGTDKNAVKSATRASSEFKGNQTSLSYGVSGLNSMLTYYWRVDAIDALGNVTRGTVWYFRPRHLAFPGAEGYGRFARGGRGGVVIEVTNLNDSGPGSLRDAVEGNYGPRTIVFTVSGIITLNSRLTLNAPYVTIAGQTAPGKGICLKKWPMGLSGANDAIIRFIRSRPGRTLQTITVDKYKNGTSGSPTTATAAVSVDGMGMQGSSHSIIDHCSISWTIDEAFSSRSAKDITLQRTLISEALNKALHPNYIFLDQLGGVEHGYAASVGGDIGSFHHNLLAHCAGRNWSMAGGLNAAGFFAGRLDFRNNAVYNWDNRTTDGGAHQVNFVSNYYKPGPATRLFTALNPTYDNFPGTQQYYMAGNVMPGRFDESNQAAGRTVSGSNGGSVPTSYSPWVETPFFESYVTTQSAAAAYKNLLSDVGCNRPMLDDHDARIIRETRDGTYTYSGSVTGKPGLPDVETDVGGWENYPALTRPANWDTDRDGMPDWWETLHGLNPNSGIGNFGESNADPDGDGYTRLEEYLNAIAGLFIESAAGSSVDIDLSQLTSGYGTAVTYSVSAPTGGTVQLLPDGRTARFTPSGNFTGLASFNFTATDAAGNTMTQTVRAHVTATPAVQLRLEITEPISTQTMEFSGSPGVLYHFESSPDLIHWTEWRTLTATGFSQTVPIPQALLSDSKMLFRARQ